MSDSELQEEVESLKEKLTKTEADFEAYKASAKQLEQFLEEQSSKKEEEIRALKQELIVKEKTSKQVKQELAMLQNDNSDLKKQLQLSSNDNSKELQLQENITKLEEKVVSLEGAKKQLTLKLVEKSTANTQLAQSASHNHQLEQKIQSLSNQLLLKGKKMSDLEEQNNKLLAKVATVQKEAIEESSSKEENKKGEEKRSQEIQFIKQQFQKEKLWYDQKVKQLESTINKNQGQMKQLKSKVQFLTEQNQQNRTANMISSNQGSPSPMLIKTDFDEQDFSLRPSYHCLLLTKPHYISPFLQIYQDKQTLKIYKSSRTGCFQKSMGSYRHKFDHLAFDQETILDPLVNKIKSGKDCQHSVIFYGVKKSSKKYLMSKLLVYLKDFILAKMETSEQVQTIFMKRSQEEDHNFTMSADSKEGALQIIDKVISMGFAKQKFKEKSLGSSRKVVQKPKVRFFRVGLPNFSLQISTSSHTSFSFREKVTASNMLNNILYSKLPNILQSNISQKHLVLTLNPIVDLYQDCKNTLSTTFCKHSQDEIKDDPEPSENWRGSPVKGELNQAAKKRMENYQKQNEETSLKIRKLEDECNYYRIRFDQLQFRLKNLLNTHSAQNTYLKKSPVTLSYQKLLKFVHSVQQRNNANASLTHTQSMMLKSHMFTEKDNESLDAV